MAAAIYYISLTCILLLVMQPMVAGLKCYVCNNCPNPSGLQTVENGTTGYSCTKKTVMTGGSASMVNRAFAPTNGCPENKVVEGGNGAINSCCTIDGCNGSIAISGSLIFIIGIAAVANLIKNIMVN